MEVLYHNRPEPVEQQPDTPCDRTNATKPPELCRDPVVVDAFCGACCAWAPRPECCCTRHAPPFLSIRKHSLIYAQ